MPAATASACSALRIPRVCCSPWLCPGLCLKRRVGCHHILPAQSCLEASAIRCKLSGLELRFAAIGRMWQQRLLVRHADAAMCRHRLVVLVKPVPH
eukprot:6209683-Pleurochrysis_carterae.AAC.1